MGFIKRGDGKIISVVVPEEMTEEQKKSAQNLSKKDKEPSIETDQPTPKKSER